MDTPLGVTFALRMGLTVFVAVVYGSSHPHAMEGVVANQGFGFCCPIVRQIGQDAQEEPGMSV